MKDARCEKSKPFGVVKKSDNKLKGCHATRDKAKKQLAALNAAEQKEKNVTTNGDMEIVDAEITPETVPSETKEEKHYDEYWTSHTSFEDMEDADDAREKAHEISHLADVISPMVSNVIHDDEIDNDSGITKIFNGFKARLNAIISKPEKKEVALPRSSFMVYKGADGELLWLSAYSNNIRDDDNPPEIIASESHEAFVKMVDDGEAELPELWLWHTPALVLGKATAVAYDVESGFAIAAGYFNKGAEPVAIAIENSDIDWGVSHGMPREHIVRSKEDPTIIVRHITWEISPLPLTAAANKYANFSILKEANMTLSEDKIRELTENSDIPEAALIALLESNKKVSDGVDEDGLERKEVDAKIEAKKEEVETPEEDQKEDVKAAFSDEQYEQLKSILEAHAKSLADVLPGVIASVVDKKLEPINEALAEKEKTREEEIKEAIANTPQASFESMLTSNLFSNLSVTESDETRVDGRTKLAKSAPDEVDDEMALGDPVLNVFNNIISGKHITPVSASGE